MSLKDFIAGVLGRIAYRQLGQADKGVPMCYLLLDRKVPLEIEAGDQAHLATDALARYQTDGEVAVASDFVSGSGMTACFTHFVRTNMPCGQCRRVVG